MGQRRLQKAIAKFPNVDFQVEWRPFQLNAQASREGVNKLEMYKQKFGVQRVEQMIPYMTQVFEGIGVKYSIGGLTGNTFDSHRLTEWATSKYGLQKADELMTQMFDAYFSNEQFLGDHKVLAKAAAKAGLPEEEASRVLADDSAFKRETEEGLKVARQHRVSGVPYFVIHPPEGVPARPVGLSGAQESDTFVEIFDDLVQAA